MAMQRNDIQHHTVAQVQGYVHDAREILDAECGDGEWSQEMFAAVLNLLASKTVQLVQPPAVGLGALPAGLFNPAGGR